MAKRDISNNMIDDDMIDKVAGGAMMKPKKYRFSCTRCHHSWTETTNHPERVMGCKRCGWWYQTLEDDGNNEKQCVVYEEA